MQAKKILLVEDDISIRENMASLLSYEGYQVIEAEHGLEAMQKLEESKGELPNLILLDLFMPIMNGREFLQCKEASTAALLREIPVILITASVPEEHQDLETKTVAIFRKPISLKDFLHSLKTIIHQPEKYPILSREHL